MKWCVETLLKVRPGGGCGTHETPGGSAVADVGDDNQFRKQDQRSKRRLMQCTSVILVGHRSSLRGHEEHGIRATCTGADIYIPRHNVEPRTEHGTLKDIQK
jgi:hypothetical protein